MSDETAEQIILADSAAAAFEEPPRRRGLFRRRRRSKLPQQPLSACENCGAELTGEWCAKCGQHAIEYRRSILRVVVDALDSFLNWDTKFLRSVGVLLTRPGRLTNDFNAGRRVRYVHPLRLYLLASIAFFLIAKLVNLTPSDGTVYLSPEDRVELDGALAKLTAPDSLLTPEQRTRVEAARGRFSAPGIPEDAKKRAAFEKAILRLPSFAEKAEFKPKDVEKLEETLARIDRVVAKSPETPDAERPAAETPPNVLPGAPPPGVPPVPEAASRKYGPVIQFDGDGDPNSPFEKWLEQRVKDKVGEDGTKGQLFLETLRSHIPSMMLCCVPLFAFVLKVLYIRQRRYYVEHLVYALHIHTFAYMAVVVITLIGMGAERWLPSFQVLLVVALSIAAAVQIFLSVRRVYRQGWFLTTFKFVLGAWIYLTVIALALVATAFITLLLP